MLWRLTTACVLNATAAAFHSKCAHLNVAADARGWPLLSVLPHIVPNLVAC
ncbi:hypothetical protein PF007_g32735 [Phytophthora fragariae]|uniref:RxLR effector protein n=1 Tax=Phytophthora fragariae TaxID=53985 RepID=A0A6A3PH53_9STRA|nr:hypothetical protein PF007_g32735 [Phytophthora fragariae]